MRYYSPDFQRLMEKRKFEAKQKQRARPKQIKDRKESHKLARFFPECREKIIRR